MIACIFLPPNHIDKIIKVHKPKCHIKHHKVDALCLQAKQSCDGRADEEQNCHIATADNTHRTDGVYQCGDVGDVELIGAVEVEVVGNFFNHKGDFLSFPFDKRWDNWWY